MDKEARLAFKLSYLRIKNADTEQEKAMFALDWFRTYGAEAYEAIKRWGEDENEDR